MDDFDEIELTPPSAPGSSRQVPGVMVNPLQNLSASSSSSRRQVSPGSSSSSLSSSSSSSRRVPRASSNSSRRQPSASSSSSNSFHSARSNSNSSNASNKSFHSARSNSQSNSRSRKLRAIRKKIKTRKIFKFMKNVNPHKRRAYFLKGVCSNSGVCLAFGKENAKIKQHFDFASFNHMTSSNRIGVQSNNGFVKLIEYQHQGYIAHAVLKSAMEETSDNLYYEYLVGKFINKQIIYYPCFLETYEAFRYKTDVRWDYFRQHSIVPKGILKSSLTKFDQLLPRSIDVEDSLSKSCLHSQYIAILIQSLKDSVTFHTMMSNPEFVQQEMVYVLFQIYMPLMCLENVFTHYDLHSSNVLIYEPIQGQFIQYHYHMPDGSVVSFKSKYIAKIIDYGRCFYHDVSNPDIDGTSRTVHSSLCRRPECAPSCGTEKGYYFTQPLSAIPSNDHYISSVVRNRSHDLILLKNLKYRITNIDAVIALTVYDDAFGTPERPNDYPNSIQTVTDACMAFKAVIERHYFKSRNDAYFLGRTKIGDLHVYNQRPMEYIPTP